MEPEGGLEPEAVIAVGRPTRRATASLPTQAARPDRSPPAGGHRQLARPLVSGTAAPPSPQEDRS